MTKQNSNICPNCSKTERLSIHLTTIKDTNRCLRCGYIETPLPIKKNKKIFVVMPAYNAEKKIESVFDNIPAEIMAFIDHVVVVNDGSQDSTDIKIQTIKQKYKKITLAIHPQNKGYGAAQKTGFDTALDLGADIIVLLHSDGQTDANLLPSLVQPILTGEVDMVLGSRMLGMSIFKSSMPFYKYCGNKLLTFLENKTFKSKISEFHTGYIAYSRKALESIPYSKLDDRFHFDGHMIIISLLKHLQIREVAVPTIYDDEISHLKAVSYAKDVLKTIRLYKQGYFHKLAEEKVTQQ